VTGPLGETHGKGGVPELEAVQPLTVAELGAQLSALAGGRACSINLCCVRGRWVACAEYAGGGLSCGVEATGTGADAETAIRAAMARLPGVSHA